MRCHRVLTDDVRVGRLATEHLMSAGRRAIAHIAGPPVVHAERRQQGYREALRASGSSPAWMDCRRRLHGRRRLPGDARLLDSRTKIDAVFAANDPAAIGAMKAVGSRSQRPRRYRHRRRQRRPQRFAARAVDDGELVKGRNGSPRRRVDPRSDRASPGGSLPPGDRSARVDYSRVFTALANLRRADSARSVL